MFKIPKNPKLDGNPATGAASAAGAAVPVGVKRGDGPVPARVQWLGLL